MQDFRKLRVWHESVEIAVEIYHATNALPASERFGLRSQLLVSQKLGLLDAQLVDSLLVRIDGLKRRLISLYGRVKTSRAEFPDPLTREIIGPDQSRPTR